MTKGWTVYFVFMLGWLVILVAGIFLGATCSDAELADAGETMRQCVREWFGATSGVFGGLIAAGVAFWIGYRQLRPLLADQYTKKQQRLIERARECVTLDHETFLQLRLLAEEMADFQPQRPFDEFLRTTFDTDEAAADAIFSQIRKAEPHMLSLERAVRGFAILPESTQELLAAKEQIEDSLTEFQRSYGRFQRVIIHAVHAAAKGAPENIRKQHIDTILRSDVAMHKGTEVFQQFEITKTNAMLFQQQLREEQRRAERLIMAQK